MRSRTTLVLIVAMASGSAAGLAAAGPCDPAAPPVVVDLPDDGFVDSNGDGIDGMACGPIFVATTGLDSNPGTTAAPMKTIGAAMIAAKLYSPVKAVYVSTGTYAERLVLVSGVSAYGGYNAGAGWTRSNAQPVVNGPAIASLARGIDQAITLDRLSIRAANGTAGTGRHSVAMVAVSCIAPITLTRCELRAGTGASAAMAERVWALRD